MPTKIEWANEVWNPLTGCTPISEACKNCYAKRMAKRLRGRYGYPADDPFRVTMHHDRLHIPGDWKKPKNIFVCSMGDIFHENVEWNWMFSIFQIAASLKRHNFLFLTKRPKNALAFIGGDGGYHLQRQGLGEWPFENIWQGVTAETNENSFWRLAQLKLIPAVVRFVSIEPMLGPNDIENHLSWLDWVICGAETGPGARPMKPEWVIDLYEQCKSAGVPFFFKKESKGLPVPDYVRETRQFPEI